MVMPVLRAGIEQRYLLVGFWVAAMRMRPLKGCLKRLPIAVPSDTLAAESPVSCPTVFQYALSRARALGASPVTLRKPS